VILGYHRARAKAKSSPSMAADVWNLKYASVPLQVFSGQTTESFFFSILHAKPVPVCSNSCVIFLLTAARVTREQMPKPRFVAGADGPTSRTSSVEDPVCGNDFRALLFPAIVSSPGIFVGIITMLIALALVHRIARTRSGVAACFTVLKYFPMTGLMCMIYAPGNCSGARSNPAVTLAIILAGSNEFSPSDGAAHISFQVLSGLCAAYIYAAMHHRKAFAPKMPTVSGMGTLLILMVRKDYPDGIMGAFSAMPIQWEYYRAGSHICEAHTFNGTALSPIECHKIDADGVPVSLEVNNDLLVFSKPHLGMHTEHTNVHILRASDHYSLPAEVAVYVQFPRLKLKSLTNLQGGGSWPNSCEVSGRYGLVQPAVERYKLPSTAAVNGVNSMAVAEFQGQNYKDSDWEMFSSSCKSSINAAKTIGGDEQTAGVEAELDIEYINAVGPDVPRTVVYNEQFSLLVWANQITSLSDSSLVQCMYTCNTTFKLVPEY